MAPKFAINIHHDDADLLSAAINFSSAAQNQIIAGVAGSIIRVYKIFFIVSAPTLVTFQDGSNNFSGAMNFSANEGIVLDFDTKPWFTMSIGNAFNITQTANASVAGTAYYTVTTA